MKIIIAESIPCLNKGEEAIFKGLIVALRQIPEAFIVYFTEYYKNDVLQYADLVDKIYSESLRLSPAGKIIKHLTKGIKLISAALVVSLLPEGKKGILFPSQIKEYLGADILIIGHDNLYINKRRLMADSLLILFAKLKGIKLISLGSSIGPFDGNKAIIGVCRFLLNKFDLIILRETRSEEYLRDLGVTRPRIEVGCDMAFLMPPIKNDSNCEIINKITMCRRAGHKTVGFSISRPVIRQFHKDLDNVEEKEQTFTREFSIFLHEIAKHMPIKFIIIDHVVGIVDADYQDDRIIHDEICKQIEDLDYIRVPSELNGQEMKAVISNLDLLIASRTHAMIAAVSSGVNVIPLSYRTNFKTIGIIGDMCGLIDNIVYMEKFDRKRLIEVFYREINNIEARSIQLNDKIPVLKQEALNAAKMLSVS